MSINFYKTFLITSAILCLNGCSSDRPAPVAELRPQYAMNKPQATYVVRPGDTLYAIAFLFDENYEQLAAANHIAYPYSLRTGQVIRLVGRQQATNRPVMHHISKIIRQVPARSRGPWRWPSQGRVAQANSMSAIDQKGISILGQPNQPIYASANGVVAYAGDGLPGYGNLILVKHNGDYLTAYAFNAKNLVREGQTVSAGQQIATMGRLDSGQWGVHFEIRYRGNAVNPMRFLASH